MKLLRCSRKGCSKLARGMGGVCKTHGKRCGHNGCANYANKGGLCSRHVAKSPASFPAKVKPLSQPAEAHEAASAVVAAKRGGEVGVKNLQSNISRDPARQSTSIRLSTTALNYPDDDEVCAWIYKSSRIA